MTEVPAGLTHVHSGKVRDLYRTADGRLLMVASDRISAFDHVLDSLIPDKGRILTAMSVWWFDQLSDVVANHVLAVDDPVIPAQWRGRALVCTALEMLPVEAVARGYLAGSGLLDYNATGTVCGIALPEGLVDADRLPEPIFTPATKAELGEHDENVSYEAVAETVGADTAAELAELTLRIYRAASDIAAARGDHPGRHQVRVRTRAGLGLARARRRGADSRFVPVLAGRRLAARPCPGQLRQAVRAQLAARPGIGGGTATPELPRHPCPTRSSRPPGRATSRPTSG